MSPYYFSNIFQGSCTEDCTDQFTHRPTQLGLCSVFNGGPLEDSFNRGGPWLQAFLKYYTTMKGRDLDIVFGAGVRNAMRLILDMHTRQHCVCFHNENYVFLPSREIWTSQASAFYMSINEKADFMDMGVNTITLDPGTRAQIQLLVQMREPAEDFGRMDIDIRF